MSRQHAPADKPLPPEEPRRLKLRRDKDEPWHASCFQLGQRLVVEYRARSGRTVRLLAAVEDVYEHDVLHCSWDNKVCLFARVCMVQDADQKPMLGRIVSVSLDARSGWISSRVRYREDLDWKTETWLALHE